MKKIILAFLFAAIFNLAQSSADGMPSNTIQGQSNAVYSSYGAKKSGWCRLMRASNCKNPAKFLEYVNKGCINDIRGESDCLLNFCGTNCATAPCPTGELATMCQDHCKSVSFPNNAAQTRLNACVTGALTIEGAAMKRAGRVYDKAYLQNLESQKRGGLREAQKVLDLVNNLSKKRQALFYVDGASLSKAGIVRIDDFIANVNQAIVLTQKMNEAVNGLAVSGQAPDIVAQARALMAKSDKQVQFFIHIVKKLSMSAEQLMQVVAQGSAQGSMKRESMRPVPASRPVSTVSTDSDFSSGGEEEQQQSQ